MSCGASHSRARTPMQSPSCCGEPPMRSRSRSGKASQGTPRARRRFRAGSISRAMRWAKATRCTASVLRARTARPARSPTTTSPGEGARAGGETEGRGRRGRRGPLVTRADYSVAGDFVPQVCGCAGDLLFAPAADQTAMSDGSARYGDGASSLVPRSASVSETEEGLAGSAGFGTAPAQPARTIAPRTDARVM